MTLVPIALANKTNPARYTQGGSARLLNCYVEEIGNDGKASWAIYAADGLQGFAALPDATGGVRAMLTVDSYLYVVAGLALYRIDSAGSVSNLGGLSISATAPVYMERNRAATPDIAIVCDGVMYKYDTTLALVTDADLLPPQTLAFLDGYFLISTSNNTWQIGALDDVEAWDALDYERADANPDSIVRVAALQRDAVIFGEVSTEFWRNTGAADFPFERVAAIDLGCLAQKSVQTVDQTLVWVAHDRTVRMLEGYQGRRISTHAVERDIEALADYDTLVATSWTKDGHTFYALSSESWTWVFDSITGLWHTRLSTGYDNWRIAHIAEFAGKLIGGDRDSGSLFEMSSNFGDEAGEPLKMIVTLPPVHAYPVPLTFHALYIDAEKGVGLSDGAQADVNPEIVLRWSKDGGYSFGQERRLALGVQGSRLQELHTHRLGRSTGDGYVFQIECSAKVVRALYQARAEVERDSL